MTNKMTPFDLMLEKAEDDANIAFLNSEIARLKAEVENLESTKSELIELLNEIINSANKYYEVENPEEQTPVILENIVFSAARIIKILTDKNHE